MVYMTYNIAQDAFQAKHRPQRPGVHDARPRPLSDGASPSAARAPRDDSPRLKKGISRTVPIPKFQNGLCAIPLDDQRCSRARLKPKRDTNVTISIKYQFNIVGFYHLYTIRSYRCYTSFLK